MCRFFHKEDGSLTILSLFFFMVMILLGGLAVDMLVFENNRTALQNLSDRASLAAADLDQTVDPEDVVQSYFEKQGLDGYLDDVKVVDNASNRSVEITARQDMKTMFMRMVGTTDLSAPAGSMAAESAGNVEVSLVLDNSGSMGTIDGKDGKTRLEKLQTAVGTFLEVMYPDGEDSHITVSIIPYATQVNAGPDITDYLNVSDEHHYSDCIEFEDTDFSSLALDMTKAYSRSAHFSMFETDSDPTYFKCRPTDAQHIYVMGSDPTKIMTRVNALTAQGQTSLELGAKWGAALLDPSANPMINALYGKDGQDIQSSHLDRPVAYTDGKTVKALILMTDGINTFHYNMNSPYKDGPSDIWRTTATISDLLSGATPGLAGLPALSTLLSKGLDLTDTVTLYSYKGERESGDEDGDGIKNEEWWVPAFKIGKTTIIPEQYLQSQLLAGEGDDVRLTWPELWAEMPPNYFANTFIKGQTGKKSAVNDFLDDLYTSVSASTKDTRLDALCDTAKAKGLTVYTVGLNVSSHSKTVLGDCASTANFYLDATSDNLEEKFEEIAESIINIKLRLVQ